MLSTQPVVSEQTAGEVDWPPDAPPRPDSAVAHLVERSAWSLVWLAVVSAGVTVWGFWWWSPSVGALAPLLVLAGIIGLAATWIIGSPRSRVFQGLGLTSVIVAVVFPQAIEINTRRFYTTDSAAFESVAARALLHGLDPYVVSMSSAARLLDVPDRFWTYTISGGHVSRISYPAGSFLLNIPAMALGMHHMVVDWVDLTAWLVTIVLLFVLLPANVRWLAPLLALFPFLLGAFSSGGTDATFLPFLVLAVWRLDRFGRRDGGAARWIGPVALGFACAIKQTPWFCLPFLAAGIFLEARRAGRSPVPLVLRYVSTVLAVFLVVNLPFIVWNPTAWLRGTLLPLTGGLVADGQGLVSLATHGVTGGVNLTLLDAAGALALVAVLAAFVVWYPYLKRVWLVLVTVPFFFAPRSLSSYLIDLVPVALVAVLTVRGVAPPVRGVRQSVTTERVPAWSVVPVAALGTGVAVCSVLAFAGSPPLQLSVQKIATSRVGRQLDSVTITVRNRTPATVTPHFMVNTGSDPKGFWTPWPSRPVVVAPHSDRTLTLYAPVSTSTPQPGARWLVEAYTSGPAWLSTSPLEPYPPAARTLAVRRDLPARSP